MPTPSREAARLVVCAVDELPPGESKIVQSERGEIGVFNVDGALYAVKNVCPHRGAPLCLGSISGEMLPSQPGTYTHSRERPILSCPWHRWQFDLTSGEALRDESARVKVYEVAVEDGAVVVRL